MPSAATKKRPSVVKEEEGMTPKKTALIIVTVIGCIAILWPKVFHPMMFGSAPPPPPQQQNLKDQRSGAPGGLRQERPAHLHPESIYQAMRERGRAIPATPTVPIVERKSSASNPPPRIVDGRPGPIPGMRPPMGAGALQQPQQRGSSMGFLMPLYTIGIVVFFGYTIMKIAFKKQVPNAPYGPAPSDTGFRQQVFGQQQEHSQVEDLGGTKLGWREHQTIVTAIQGLIDAADEQLNVRDKQRSDTETDLNKQNDNEKTKDQLEKDKEKDKISSNGHANVNTTDQGADPAAKGVKQQQQRKRRDLSAERELTVLGMEVTASCEGGRKWTGRPPTPVFRAPIEHSKLEGNLPEPQSIYLEGALAHDSQILVADAQTKREEVYDTELNGSAEEPAVILSSKMTLSLINLDANQQNGNWGKPEIESPLADDIEIIGHDEQ
ncbi:resistance to inhibitors of cholinesterase protein 3 isoform X12 [Drosophila pseudoobscura]|uniref:Resistance to inhibitors of cholinesterase protein 3 isoform X12 n=1 Tax=Drosophila pseudoobscura pseudoobscura TaxID=46245 RepID=A0A6I8VSA7_DROPS|nr:resistance to inhibitors of cholinesterase protein 3 isoform X12 [Drosophila pseudoobscura]